MKTKCNGIPISYRKKLLIIMMRSFIFLFCVTAFGFTTEIGFSQNRTVVIDSDREVTVEELLNLIGKQTSYSFIYKSDLFEDAPKVKLEKGEARIGDLLAKGLAFANIGYQISMDGSILLNKSPNNLKFKESIVQQQVSGTVVDAYGTPLPGATVNLKSNPTLGTQTDFDGNYVIETTGSGDVLVFRYLGFVTKEIAVGNQTVINVTLEEDAQGLDEVVIVGYGTQKKSDVTGAISSVKSEELNKVVVTNPTDALQGRVSGVTVTSSSGSPGAVSDVLIRGVGSFGNNQPLYIIDGVQADPYYLDPINIESIEVLKDAASGAIYGTKAANGVVIITTKKGESGKPRIEINSSYSINSSREIMELLDADGYVQVHQQMYANAGSEIPTYVTNPPNVDTDWVDETHRTGYLNLLNARISGASEYFNYSVAGNYADEEGILIGSRFSKKGITANLGVAKGKLKIQTNLNYSETYREPYKFSLRETYFISPLIPVFDATKPSGYGYRDGDLPDHRNPVGENAFLEEYNKAKYFLGTVNVSYELFKGLVAGANLSYSVRDEFEFAFHKPFQVRAAQEEGREFAFISEYDNEFKRYNQEYTLKYDFDVNEKHNFQLLAGYQRIREPYKWNFTQAEGYKIQREVVDGAIVEERVPAEILDPDFRTLNAFNDGTFFSQGSNAEYSLASQFGRINYAFDDKYLFQASIRRDGSSKFGSNNKYGVFPSFALGWKLTSENFMEDQDAFDFLKLRFSWGQAGNDSALGYYDYVALISQGKSQDDGGYVFGNPQTSYQGSIARELQNDNLQWETNTSYNLGLDFASLGNRLTGAINYYNSTTEDLLITKVVSPAAGVNNPVVNVGEFENSGLEFEIGYTNKDGAFNYSAFATFTTINSEVTKLSNEDQTIYGIGLLFGSDHFVNQTKIGYEPGAYFLPVADGIFQNQTEIDAHSVDGTPIQPEAAPGDIRFVDQNGDGVINSDDEVYQGSAIPDYEYSLNLSADYKGFDVNVFFQGVGGNKIYNGNDFRLMSMDTGRNYRKAALNAWTQDNPNTNIPRAVLGDPNRNNRASTRFLENGDYLRIKTISLGYSLPKKTVDNIGINRLRFFMTGQNLFTFTSYSGLDPEVGASISGQNQSILSRGIDLNLYPKTKSFIFGMQLEF